MSTEHTPGPWHPRTQRVAIGIYSGSGELIATVTPGRESKTADARLIAAAPLMLHELYAAAAQIEALGGDARTQRAAIAEATGEQP